MNDVALGIFALFNMIIFGGYVFIAFYVAPRLKVQWWVTKVGSIGFFLTCGLTHAHLGLHAAAKQSISLPDMTAWTSMLIHGTQAIFVWMFVLGLYKEVLNGWAPATKN